MVHHSYSSLAHLNILLNFRLQENLTSLSLLFRARYHYKAVISEDDTNHPGDKTELFRIMAGWIDQDGQCD